MEFNFKRDINKTIEMMEKIKEGKEINDPKYSQVYPYSTLNHQSLYSQMGGNFESFLGVTGSMSPAFNIINLGGKDITCFDISLPAFCYAYFQIAAVLGLTYQEYIHFIFDHAGHRSFNFDTYQKIREYLPNINPMNVRKYFDTIYDYLGEDEFRMQYFISTDYLIKEKSFDRFFSGEQSNNLFLTEETFNKLKKNLQNISFKNLWIDIRNIPEFLSGNTYDKIILSCANHFMYESENVDWDTIYDYMRLLEKFKSLLKKDGQLQGALMYISKENGAHQYEQYERLQLLKNGYSEITCDNDSFIDFAYVYKKY